MAEQKSITQNYATPYKFTGKELDEETGLYYFGARYYAPRESIWLSTDPLAEVNPNQSPYNFCSNNPISRTDPTGMLDDDIYVNTTTQQVSVIKTNDNYDRVIVNGKNTGNTEKGEYKSTYEGYKTNDLKINYKAAIPNPGATNTGFTIENPHVDSKVLTTVLLFGPVG